MLLPPAKILCSATLRIKFLFRTDSHLLVKICINIGNIHNKLCLTIKYIRDVDYLIDAFTQ